jgi:hypothetical protein
MRKHHKRIVQSGGGNSDGKIPFPLMTKGERFNKCRGKRQRTEAWFQGEKIYHIQRIEAWFKGDHE